MKNVIQSTLVVCIVSLFSFGTMMAQEAEPSKKLGIGFQLSQYQQDFGVGLNVTSPYFVHKTLAIRVRANLMFNEHIQSGEMTWTPYSNITLGVLSSSATMAGFMRLYGEGGVIGIMPSSDFSDESFVIGGYGLFGFEFFMSTHFNYFIEIGGIGSGASADKVPTKPIYSNGLSISTGFRVVL